MDTKCFIVLQIQNDFRLGIVDDTLTKTAIVQIKEVVQVLAGEHSGTAETTNGLCDFKQKIACQPGACGTCAGKKLPALIDENCFFLSPILLGTVPNKVQGNEHTNGQQIAGQRRNIQNRILVIQRYICLLVKGTGRTVYQAVKNIGHSLRAFCLRQQLIQIT